MPRQATSFLFYFSARRLMKLPLLRRLYCAVGIAPHNHMQTTPASVAPKEISSDKKRHMELDIGRFASPWESGLFLGDDSGCVMKFHRQGEF